MPTILTDADKKKLQDQKFYNYTLYKGLAPRKKQLKKYDQAEVLFGKAIENAEPDKARPLILARSDVRNYLVNSKAARSDVQNVLEQDPEDIRAWENEARTIYEQREFEEALIRHYQGLERRRYPDAFYKGVLVSKETLEDCIGRTAGPVFDLDRMGQVIVNKLGQPHKNYNTGHDEVRQAKEKHKLERIDYTFAQKYFGRGAKDKKFLKTLTGHPAYKTGPQYLQKTNAKLEDMFAQQLERLEETQETLRIRRPMYTIKYEKGKISEKMKEQKQKDLEHSRMAVKRVVDKLQTEAEDLQKNFKKSACLNVCERLRRFVEHQPRNLMPDSVRDTVLTQLYSTVGELHVDAKTFVPSFSDVENEGRIEHMVYANLSDPDLKRRIEDTVFPPFAEVKNTRAKFENRLANSINRTERIFLYHEISRCYFQEKNLDMAYKTTCYAYEMAKSARNSVWRFNTGFLQALALLMDGNTDDAKIILNEVMIEARKMDRDDCRDFIKKVVEMAVILDRLNYDDLSYIEKRETEIIGQMPSREHRIKVKSMLQQLKGKEKKVLRPSEMRTLAHSGSRRSMKIVYKKKRKTVLSIKSSRQLASASRSMRNTRSIELLHFGSVDD